jgi:hypothetical protein
MKNIVVSLLFMLLLSACTQNNKPEGRQEKLGRGLIAIRQENGVYLGWRLLFDDPQDVVFNIYRRTNGKSKVKINNQPVAASTNFVDTETSSGEENEWIVVPVVNGQEQKNAASVKLSAHSPCRNYKSFKLAGEYSANKVGIADFNGDGVYDLLVKQPGGSLDPGTQRRSTDTYKYEAYDGKTGKQMWRYDLGWNVDMGIWWSPAIAYDFDGDGKAEVAFKASDYAGSEAESYLKEGNKFIMEGPEYCIILDGETGTEIDRADWIPRGDPEMWGDNRGNRVNRNQIGVACLDGKTPSLLVCRGTYTIMRIDAYNLVDKKLEKIWSWSGEDENPPVRGQGAHGMHACDVDGDGKDEILFGDAVLDDNGKLLWSMKMGHPDIFYLADVDYDRPGLEIYYGFESRQDKNGMCLVDPATGNILWGIDFPTTHLHDWGMIGDIDPSQPGMEFFAMEQNRTASYLYNGKGEPVSDGAELGGGHTARALYWKDGPIKVFYPFSYSAKVNPLIEFRGDTLAEIPGKIIAIADMLGDWREEIITALDGEVRIYTTTIPSASRRVCLMQDPLYRLDVAMVTMGYFYVPQLSRPWEKER